MQNTTIWFSIVIIFEEEKKDFIEVASLGCYYSCSQCAQILRIFTFDDDKYSVLELMASRIIDLQNVNLIYQQFTFDDARQKAANILQARAVSLPFPN